MRGARKGDAQGASWQLLLCVWFAGRMLYAEGALERVSIKMGLGQQTFELVVLGFNSLRSLGMHGLHTAELGTPLVQPSTAEAILAAQLFDRHTGLRLLEEAEDLRFGESAFLQIHHSFGSWTFH